MRPIANWDDAVIGAAVTIFATFLILILCWGFYSKGYNNAVRDAGLIGCEGIEVLIQK